MRPLAPGSLAGLRVAHLIESDGPGGAERIVAQIATTLQAAGACSVAFLPARGEGWLARELEGSGVAIEHFHIDRPFSPACARSLAEAFRRHRIAVAHSHEFSMAVYGAWASRRARVPHLITMHGGRYYAARLRRRVALRAAIAVSGRTIAVSSPLARDLCRDLRLPDAHIDTIPNGVRGIAPENSALRAELGLRPEDRLLVAVGNLYPAKGHRYLIEALALLTSSHPDVHLAISGRGGEHERLVSRARELGVGHRLHLLGLRGDIPSILAAADVYVHPSVQEGLPLAILEAMFAARPIVATAVGDVPAALADGEAGSLVEPGDAAALAAALDDLLRNPLRARRLAVRAAARAAAEYGVERMVERYLSIYDELLARRRAA